MDDDSSSGDIVLFDEEAVQPISDHTITLRKSLISTFPPELIIRIISFLNTMDRIRCSRVCRQWRDIFEHHPVGRYSVECDLCSVTNGTNQKFNTEQRLSLLQEYRDSWRFLRWKDEITFDLTPDTILRLHGSILGSCDVESPHACFDFTQIPSAIRNVKRRVWTVELPDLKPVDYEIDSNQNLLVVMERLGIQEEGNDAINCGGLRLHFRTLDTGDPHPSSVESIDLLVRPPCTEDWYLHLTEICGEYIAIMVVDESTEDFGDCEFWLWNWKEGYQVMNLCSGPRNIAESFTFLSPGTLLVPIVVPSSDSLLGTLGFLAIFDCKNQIQKRHIFSEAMKEHGSVIFQLPEPSNDSFYRRILLGASSCSTQPSNPSPHSFLDNDVLFFADMRTRLFVLDVIISDSADEVRGLTFLVPSSALERKYRCSVQCRKRTLYHSRSWIKDTRLTTEALLQSHTSVFQRRCVAPDYTSDDPDSRVVVMYEMSSSLGLRRDAHRAPEIGSQYILAPSTDRDLDAWMEPITTKLPYRKFISNIDPGRTSDLHLGEDCLIIRCNETHKCRVLLF